MFCYFQKLSATKWGNLSFIRPDFRQLEYRPAFEGLALEYRPVILRVPFEIYSYITASFEEIRWTLSQCSDKAAVVWRTVEAWFDSQEGQEVFLVAQTGSVAEPASYSVDTGGKAMPG